MLSCLGERQVETYQVNGLQGFSQLVGFHMPLALTLPRHGAIGQFRGHLCSHGLPPLCEFRRQAGEFLRHTAGEIGLLLLVGAGYTVRRGRRQGTR